MFDRDEFTTDSFMNPHQLRPHMLDTVLIKIVAVEELYVCPRWRKHATLVAGEEINE